VLLPSRPDALAIMRPIDIFMSDDHFFAGYCAIQGSSSPPAIGILFGITHVTFRKCACL
jgi:hypothetical protein